MFAPIINERKRARVQLILAELQSARKRVDPISIPVSPAQNLPEIELAIVREVERQTAEDLDDMSRAREIERDAATFNKIYFFAQLCEEITEKSFS